MKKAIFIFFFSLLFLNNFSQQDSTSLKEDSIARAKANRKLTYSGPRKASIMSAILPGLGQAYNRKFWKIPIIYAGLGGLGYLFVSANQEYTYYRKNLIADNDQDPATVNETRWDSQQLQDQKIKYRKQRDVAAVGIALLYILNIIDANVDAHLKTFDVSDDLSLNIEPWHNVYNTGSGYRTASGLSLKLKFK